MTEILLSKLVLFGVLFVLCLILALQYQVYLIAALACLVALITIVRALRHPFQ